MRIFGWVLPAASRSTAEGLPAISGFLAGETQADRIERVASDATELCRRAYAGFGWSRRDMQALAMGQRRWASAYAYLRLAGAVGPNGELVHSSQVIARRALAACRDHHLHALSRGRYAAPF